MASVFCCVAAFPPATSTVSPTPVTRLVTPKNPILKFFLKASFATHLTHCQKWVAPIESAGSLQLVGHFIGRDPQIGVVLDHRFGFATRVQHRRVVAAAKVLADLMVARSG